MNEENMQSVWKLDSLLYQSKQQFSVERIIVYICNNLNKSEWFGFGLASEILQICVGAKMGF